MIVSEVFRAQVTFEITRPVVLVGHVTIKVAPTSHSFPAYRAFVAKTFSVNVLLVPSYIHGTFEVRVTLCTPIVSLGFFTGILKTERRGAAVEYLSPKRFTQL